MRSILRRIFRQPEAASHSLAQRPRVAIRDDRELVYAIGDIHGCYDALRALEDRISADAELCAGGPALIVYLGDYVDRGPDSKRVIDHLCRRVHQDNIERLTLCGNHDDSFLKFIRNPIENVAWLDFGGGPTLRSYGLGQFIGLRRSGALMDLRDALREVVPEEHIRFFEALPTLAIHRERVFVHAGIRPGIALADQTDEDLMWIREPFLAQGPGLPVTVIHGHTAGVAPVFGKGRICIDTACYATGRLTALRLTRNEITPL